MKIFVDISYQIIINIKVGNLMDVYHFLMPVQGFAETKSITGFPETHQLTRLLKSEHSVCMFSQNGTDIDTL